ncbi:MAG: hypothetical protein IKY20_06785 [Alistipes sp.]|nr:hypothetical protein [Alistipes sp.]
MKRLMYSFWVLLLASAFVACADDDKGKNLPVGKNEDFKIEVTELTTATIKATITPKDRDMMYVAQVEAINDIDLDWRINSVYNESEHALVNIGVMSYVDYAIINDIDILEFITEYNVGGKGEIVLERQIMEPGHKYGVVVIGIETYTDKRGNLDIRTVTPVCYEIVETNIALNKDISFETSVNIDPVIGSDILLDVKPNGWDGVYFCKLYERYEGYDTYEYKDIFDATPDEMFMHYKEQWHRTFIDYARLADTEGFYAMMATYSFSGELSKHKFQLRANKDYCLVIYALEVVDGLLQVVSYPQFTHFTTSIYQNSDITFDVEIGEVNSRRVVYGVTPSSDMEGYCSVVMSVAEYNDWDEELLKQRIADQCVENDDVRFGNANYEDYTLIPDTDYYVVCLGCHGEVATSEMTTIPFRTEPEREADSKIINVEACAPFHAETLYNYDPVKYADRMGDWQYNVEDFYATGVDMTLEGEPRMIYSRFFADEEVDGKSREDIIAMLRKYKSYEARYYFIKYDMSYHFYAMVMDEDGDIDLYISPDTYCFGRGDILTSKEDIERLAEIYDKAKALQNQNKSAVIAPDTPEAEAKEMCVNAM